jgi:hypothetical protein
MSPDNPSSEEQRKIDFIESLLHSAYAEESSNCEDRIGKVMSKIHLTSKAGSIESKRSRRFTWKRVLGSSIAASILIAFVFLFQAFSNSQKVMAAIDRGMAAAAEDIARHYRIVAVYKNMRSRPWLTAKTEQDGKDERSYITSDLYVRGNDQFALRHPALVPGSDLWIGQSGQDAWIVPAFGPVRSGTNTLLAKWLNTREKISTPYLHVTTVLSRMSKGYHVEDLGESHVELEDGRNVLCQKIIGVRKPKLKESGPDRIEFWSDMDSGLVMRLNIDWHLDQGETGRERVEISLLGEPELADSWFDAQGHYEGFRRRVQLDVEDKLD